jgi:hypothetical protein
MVGKIIQHLNAADLAAQLHPTLYAAKARNRGTGLISRYAIGVGCGHCGQNIAAIVRTE